MLHRFNLLTTVGVGLVSSKPHGVHPAAGLNNSRNFGGSISGTAYYNDPESTASATEPVCAGKIVFAEPCQLA